MYVRFEAGQQPIFLGQLGESLQTVQIRKSTDAQTSTKLRVVLHLSPSQSFVVTYDGEKISVGNIGRPTL